MRSEIGGGGWVVARDLVAGGGDGDRDSDRDRNYLLGKGGRVYLGYRLRPA